MSEVKKEELKKEISAILKDADLSTISSKKVRQQIEERLDVDLASRKKEIDELVMDYIEKRELKDNKGKKNGDVNDDGDDDEEEEEEDEADEEEEEEEEVVKKPKRGAAAKKVVPVKRKKTSSDESDEPPSENDDDEYNPKKKSAAKKPGKRGRKKKAADSDDDSDEDWNKGKKKAAKKATGGAKRGGGGYTKPVHLSADLAELLGEDSMPRHEVVKRIWALIKERNLYDPKNKQFAICDDELFKIFGVKRFRTFGMMKFLKNHFTAE